MVSNEVLAARGGQSVLFVSENAAQQRESFSRMAALEEEVVRTVRVRGAERISYKSGGVLMFVAINQNAARGVTADVVSVTAACYGRPRVMDELTPCLASKDSRVFVRA